MQELTQEVKNIRLLIVDDAPSMRSLLSAILKSFGITHIFEASDGKEAMQFMQKSNIDLIFCDWEMPKLDGLQFFAELKKDEQLQNIPFVLVTSMAELDKVKTAMQAGVKDYIVKPFKQDTILSKIIELFSDTDIQNF